MNIETVAQKLDDHIKYTERTDNIFLEKMSEMLKKQDYTNGNVRDLLLWRSFFLGGLGVITALVIPLVIYVWINR
jgi:hypothetical protein